MRFVVRGKPEPAGSKRGFVVAGHVNIVDANKKAKPWQVEVKAAAIEAAKSVGLLPYEGPVIAHFEFEYRRPASHYNSKGRLNALGRRTIHKITKPDTLKLARAIEDALTGIVYRDDAQIVRELIEKRYGQENRVVIEINPVAQVMTDEQGAE